MTLFIGTPDHHPQGDGARMARTRRRSVPVLRLLAAGEQEDAAAGEHVVDLVHAGVGMELVLLAGLEGVQAHQHPLRLEEGRLAHLAGVVDGVVLGTEGGGMVHRRLSGALGSPTLSQEG
jgi:hypothetical protein